MGTRNLLNRPAVLRLVAMTVFLAATATATAVPNRDPGPQTRLTEAPPRSAFERRPAFEFVANGDGSSFECRLDDRVWSPCRSPYRTKRLTTGRHGFEVRATVRGSVDSTPAAAVFRVVRRDEVVGRSVRGRAIRTTRIGDPEGALKVLVVGSIHGNETQGHRVVDRLRRSTSDGQLEGIDLWTIRTINPDGAEANNRTNAHGIDLNRNFSKDFDPSLSGGNESGPGPFSEPESRATARLSKRVEFDLAIWYHQPFGVTLVPCNSSGAVAKRYGELSGLDAKPGCDGYSPGSAINWQHHKQGTAAFVVEFPGRDLHGNEVRSHAKAVLDLSRELATRAG